jgi:hypothetical protein
MKLAHSKMLNDASGVRAPYTVCSPFRAGPKWKFESISFMADSHINGNASAAAGLLSHEPLIRLAIQACAA